MIFSRTRSGQGAWQPSLQFSSKLSCASPSVHPLLTPHPAWSAARMSARSSKPAQVAAWLHCVRMHASRAPFVVGPRDEFSEALRSAGTRGNFGPEERQANFQECRSVLHPRISFAPRQQDEHPDSHVGSRARATLNTLPGDNAVLDFVSHESTPWALIARTCAARTRRPIPCAFIPRRASAHGAEASGAGTRTSRA